MRRFAEGRHRAHGTHATAPAILAIALSGYAATSVAVCRYDKGPVPPIAMKYINMPAASFVYFGYQEKASERALTAWSPDRHTYRICLYSPSYEAGIYEGKPSVQGKLITTIAPGSCVDVNGRNLFAKYLCSASESQCSKRLPFEHDLHGDDGAVCHRDIFWMSGWSVAKSHFKKVETAQRTIVGPDGYFAESAAKQELLQVANLSEPDYYTMCGSHRFSVIYDESDWTVSVVA